MSDSYFATPVSTWEHNIGLNLETIRQEPQFIHDGFAIGTYPGHDPREDHAADWGLYSTWQTSDSHSKMATLADYLWANHEALGLWYVIWYRHIISITPGRSYWRDYVNPVPSRRGTPSGDHLNHVHVSWHLGGNVPIYHPHHQTIIGHFHIKGAKDKASPQDQNYVNDGSFLWGLSNNPDHGGVNAQKFGPYQKCTIVQHGHDSKGHQYWVTDHGRWLRAEFLHEDTRG